MFKNTLITSITILLLLIKCFKKLRRSTNQKINLFCRYCITNISFFTNMIDKLNKVSKSNVAYHFWCSGCESSYIGKSDFLKLFVLFMLDKFEFKVHQDVDFWISFYFLFQGYLDAKNLRYSLIPSKKYIKKKYNKKYIDIFKKENKIKLITN